GWGRGAGRGLAGWSGRWRTGAAVIVLPARGRSGPLEHVRMLARHGYGVLIFDPRGTGQSEGDPYRWGADKDVKAALDYLHRRPDVDARRIGGLRPPPRGARIPPTARPPGGPPAPPP